MKKSSIAAFILSLLFYADLSARFNLQAGASAVVSKTMGICGEITGNFQWKRNLSIGMGTRPIKFGQHSHLYVPVYGSFKYYHSLSGSRLFASIDAGYGIYSPEHVLDGGFDYHRKGAIYLSGGVGIMGNSKLSPYASVHFTRFGFTEQYGPFSQYGPVSTFAFTAGLVINRPSSPNTPVKRPEKLPVLHTQEYYLRKSKRQKTTAWVLLGSGVTLLTTGIIVAARQEDGVEAAISLVFIGGPGVVLHS